MSILSVLFGPVYKLLSSLLKWTQDKTLKREDEEWSRKFNNAIAALSNALPRILKEGTSPGFRVLVPDEAMRTRIETYIIEPFQPGARVKPRNIGAEQLRDTAVRRTIQDVLDCVDELKHQKPGIAARLHI
jgi:hypothetical protein